MISTSFLARSTLRLTLLVILSVTGEPAIATSITLFSTGVDANGMPLSGGTTDPHWTIVAGPGITNPTPAVVLDNQVVGNYAQSKDSAWVWEDASGAAAYNSPYTFQLRVDLTGFNPSTATISGAWGIDNDGSILLNGSAPAGSGALTLDGGDVHGNYQSFHAFQITGGFVSGINTLDFLATDLGAIGGLNVNNLVLTGSSVPEPSAFAMATIGAVVIASSARSRRRSPLPQSNGVRGARSPIGEPGDEAAASVRMNPFP